MFYDKPIRIFNIKTTYCAILIFLPTATGQECPTIILQNSKDSFSGETQNIVTSNEFCSDDNDNLVVRVCKNESWFPDSDPVCSKSTDPRRCPLNFEETDSSCRYITEPIAGGNNCENHNFQISKTANRNNILVWAPYRRISKYGPFMSVVGGEHHGKPFTQPLKASLADPDFFNKHCLVQNTSSYEFFPDFCDKELGLVCEFNKKQANSRCPNNCVTGDFLKEKCYCKEKSLCPTRLSTIDTIFELTILRDLLDGDDECYVDSNLLPTNETQALSKTRWFYPNTSLHCSLCSTHMYKTEVNKGEAEMVLYFDTTNRLLLIIYLPDNLDHWDNINCYTDAAQYELTKRIEIEMESQHPQKGISYIVYRVTLEKYLGDYWCETYKNANPQSKVYSNTILAYNIKTGNEFALQITIKNICILLNCSSEYNFDYPKLLGKINFSHLRSQLRVMEINRFYVEFLDILCHITTENKVKVPEDYAEIKAEVEGIPGIEIGFFRNSEYCLQECFNNMTWPLTKIGQATMAEEMCLQENGLPVVRICKGNFLRGSNWSDVVGECHKDMELPHSTKYIQSILKKTLNDEIINNVTTVIKQDPNCPVTSIYMVSKFLDTIYKQSKSSQFDAISSTLEITDNLLNVNKDSLVSAQEILNVTDDILDVVDNILGETTAQLLLQKDNLMMHVTNPILSGISGLVVYEEGTKKSVKDLSRGSNFSHLGPNAIVAMLVPEKIISYRNSSNMTIITKIYYKHTFFESNNSKKPSGPIISVTIPQIGFYLRSPIYILFRATNTDKPECGFWDYGKKTTRQKGRWSTVGGHYLGKIDNDSFYHICAYSHLTHFSLLTVMMNDNFSVTDDTIMDIIFYLGDALTIIGIIGIFVTAIMFKRWRNKKGTVILLNLSVAILLEVCLMQITENKVFFAPQGCGVLGIFLHYIIISKFCWMLVYSFLQYMRFVKVLSVLPENIVLKSTMFGWGLAIIPVAIVNIITRAAYSKKKYNFCYPTGMFLYLGTLLPVGVVIIINTYVFITVMREVTSKNVESHSNKEIIHKLHLQLAILLFFLLGVPWLFFVLANFIPITWLRTTLAYLFCVTSNVQGFILFLFYVVFNTETRISWINYFSNKRRKKTFPINAKVSNTS